VVVTVCEGSGYVPSLSFLQRMFPPPLIRFFVFIVVAE